MLKKRIIPCLDVDNGRVVKGVNFIDLVDAGDPVEQARIYDSQNADELCLLDITASSDNRETLYDVVTNVAEQCFMPLTVGGGVKNCDDIQKLLLSGADKVSINSAAVLDPHFIREASNRFGSQCIVVGIDAKFNNEKDIFEVYTHGGRKNTGIEVLNWAKKVVSLGAGEILLTSMDRDGTKQGFDIKLTSLISNNVSVPVIASGGVGKLQDFVECAEEGNASAFLAASIFHFGTFKIEEVKDYMQKSGIQVRIEG